MINKFKDFLNAILLRWRPYKDTNSIPEIEGEPALARERLSASDRMGKVGNFFRSFIQSSGLAARFQKGNWGAVPDKMLAKESLTSHHRFFLVAFLMVTTYSVGKIAAIVLRGRPQFDPPTLARDLSIGEDFDPLTLNQVKNSDPFKTTIGGTGPVLADTNCESADTNSSLPLKLINTVVLQDSVKSIASVQVRSGRELKEVHEGDSLDGMAKIFRITRLELVIKNLQTGACELLTSDKAKEQGSPITLMSKGNAAAFKQQQKIKGIDNVGNKYTISKDLLNDKLKDISSVLTQARAIKIQNPDGSIAFKITEIEAGGVFSYLGIQNDDIITSIDGRPITDLNEVMGLFGKLKTIDKLKLGIRREGDESELDYNMKQ